jgi:hypothetical protein
MRLKKLKGFCKFFLDIFGLSDGNDDETQHYYVKTLSTPSRRRKKEEGNRPEFQN